MAADTIYSIVYVTVNDALMTEHASMQMRRMSDAQVVKTVAKGFAGMSPGAPMCEIDVSNALPQAGFEFDAGNSIMGLVPAEIGVQAGSKTGVSKGFIIEDTISGAVDSPSGYSYRFVGTYPLFT